MRRCAVCLFLWCGFLAGQAGAQSARPLLPIPFEHSAEFGWLRKPVLASRVLDEMKVPANWRFTGTGKLSFPPGSLRVDMQMFTDSPAPTRNRLSTVNLRRAINNEDWRSYNRLSMWIRPHVSGFPMLPIQIALHNDGAEKVPDVYGREGTHFVTLANNEWQQVVWEIDPLPRDRVTMLEFGYWVNKMLAAPTDRVAFEIRDIQLQRVEPDVHTGWNPGVGKIAFSHSGYPTRATKTAIANGLPDSTFSVVRIDDNALGVTVLTKPVRRVQSRLGAFQELEFSELKAPGNYVIRAGSTITRPFSLPFRS